MCRTSSRRAFLLPLVVPVTDLVSVPWWIWLVAVLAVISAGVAAVLYRRSHALEETVRRQLAREVALKARFDDLFDRSSEIMIVHDRRGRVSTINRSGEELTGYLREELRMLDANWIFGTDYLDAVMDMIAEGADSGSRTFRSEFVPRKGNPVPVDVHARVLVGDGEVVGVTSIARDLTERARLENELRQAQKMEAVGRLATGIAHDFNNLITVLLGYSDELIEEATPNTTLHAAAVEVRRAADRASALTQQLLAFSRRQSAVAHAVNINQVIQHMEDLIRRLIGPEIRLQYSLQPDIGTISADAQQIGQVLMNLVVNARDAMPGGGTLSIATANVELGSEHVDVIPGPHVALMVTDTGLGMTDEVRNRMFEPFFTTKDQGRGTGLGLAMVQAIVRQSGGHINVESQPNQGATFKVYFPVQADLATAPVPEATAQSSVTVKGAGIVLLAEDDPSVRRLVVTELTRRGFTVLEAEDGSAALELLKLEKHRVDVLVTDVVMPKMNGADLAKAADRVLPGIKILFISGHPERAGAGLDPTGVTNLLMKPFTADTLAARIKDLIAGKKVSDGWSV
jgi:two-component system cell cycle sensor histidine kinase/response regulator CckA